MTWAPKLLWSVLDFNPHPAQEEILYHVDRALRKLPGAPRFLDCTTGRQFGKTTAAEAALWMAVTAPEDEFGPPCVKVIADTYEHGRLVWDRFVNHAFGSDLLRPLVAKFDKERELVTFKSGASAQLLSTDRPQGLTGFTLSFCLADEAAFISDAALEMLLPCLAVRQGVLLAFGTAEGQGWHRTWFLRGEDPNYPDHWSASYPSTASPYFPPEELETQRLLLPRRRFEQLYLARWQNEEGAVFHNIENCILSGVPEHTDPDPNRRYVIGVDFGRHLDFTVAYVGDVRTGRVVHQERFSQVEWSSQLERIAQLATLYNKAVVVADATGLGDVLVGGLQERGIDVVGVVLTPASKDRLIQRLVVALEREEIRFPEYEQLIRELRVYETRTLPSGRVQTGAPVGYHDDCVMALALLNEGLEKGYNSGERVSVEEFGWEKI